MNRSVMLFKLLVHRKKIVISPWDHLTKDRLGIWIQLLDFDEITNNMLSFHLGHHRGRDENTSMVRIKAILLFLNFALSLLE